MNNKEKLIASAAVAVGTTALWYGFTVVKTKLEYKKYKKTSAKIQEDAQSVQQNTEEN